MHLGRRIRALERTMQRLTPQEAQRRLIVVQYETPDGQGKFAFAIEFRPDGTTRQLNSLAELEAWRRASA